MFLFIFFLPYYFHLLLLDSFISFLLVFLCSHYGSQPKQEVLKTQKLKFKEPKISKGRNNNGKESTLQPHTASNLKNPEECVRDVQTVIKKMEKQKKKKTNF
jgi:hypothetical protein